jgi:predicted Zn-dependent protease
LWRELGKAYVSLRKSDEARQALSEALKRTPGDDEASYFLGALDVLEGRIDEGIPRLEQTRAARPDFWGSYYYLGRARLAQKHASAVDLLETAARMNPDEAPIFFQLARALAGAGRNAEAAQARARFTELSARRRNLEQESLVAR